MKFSKTSIFILLCCYYSIAIQNSVIGLYEIENNLNYVLPDSFNIYVAKQLTSLFSDNTQFIQFTTKFDGAIRDSSIRNSLTTAATYGKYRQSRNGEIEVIFDLIDFKNNSLYEKTIPIQNRNIKDAAITAALQIKSVLEGSTLSRLVISSTPSHLSITIDGKKEGLSPKELILNPGFHEITIEGDRIKQYTEVITVNAGSTLNFNHQAEIKYYPTWVYTLIGLTTSWEAVLLYNLNRRDKNKGLKNGDNSKNALVALTTISISSWIGCGIMVVKNKKLKKKYIENFQKKNEP